MDAQNASAAVLEEVAIAGENLSHISCGATSAASRWPLTTASLVEMLILEVESTWTACTAGRGQVCLVGPLCPPPRQQGGRHVHDESFWNA